MVKILFPFTINSIFPKGIKDIPLYVVYLTQNAQEEKPHCSEYTALLNTGGIKDHSRQAFSCLSPVDV